MTRRKRKRPRPRRQRRLFAPGTAIRLAPDLRRAALPALAELIAAALVRPAREGEPHDTAD